MSKIQYIDFSQFSLKSRNFQNGMGYIDNKEKIQKIVDAVEAALKA